MNPQGHVTIKFLKIVVYLNTYINYTFGSYCTSGLKYQIQFNFNLLNYSNIQNFAKFLHNFSK